MPPKTQQLQIRVTAAEKALLKKRAAAAGMDLSSYVLRRALNPVEARLDELLHTLAEEREPKVVLAALNRVLADLESAAFREVVEALDVGRLSAFHRNYVAAMVEHRAAQLGIAPPRWTAGVEPETRPWFATELPQLRPYLLQVSPVVFKRRNLFVDATVGDHL